MNKTLVVYFSHAGETYFADGYRDVEVGNAKIIAKKAQSLLGSDIFEIETVREYSRNYRKCCDEAQEELNKGELPELQYYLDSVADYDNIVLVYPCWWGTMPRAVFTFLNHYDFADKTIYPICTHEGSGMGRSESDLEQVCPKSTIARGLAVQGTQANTCDDKLKNWLIKSGLEVK